MEIFKSRFFLNIGYFKKWIFPKKWIFSISGYFQKAVFFQKLIFLKKWIFSLVWNIAVRAYTNQMYTKCMIEYIGNAACDLTRAELHPFDTFELDTICCGDHRSLFDIHNVIFRL